jgi:sulfide:quinone oxidoreductase
VADTTTLILGAGFGGIVTANALRRLLPPEHRIVVIDKARQFYIGATKPWVMLGHRTIAEISHSREALRERGIEFLHAEVQGIDLARGEIATGRGAQRGDHLVIALGADYDNSAVPGLGSAAHEFYTPEGAARLCAALRAFSGGDLIVLVPRAPFKCPPAPYEAAMLMQHAFEERGVRHKVRIALCTIEGAPMATAGSEMSQFMREQLASRNIAYHPGRKTTGVDGARHAVKFEDGSEAHFDLLVTVPPHVAPKVVHDAGLPGPSGWIPADPATLKVACDSAFRSVYAIGDVSVVSLPGRHKPDMPLVLPKAGTIADAQGRAVASQIAAAVLGRPAETFGGTGTCYIEIGGERAVKGEGQFYAMPAPVMRATPPDRAQYEGKLAWIREWLSANLNP